MWKNQFDKRIDMSELQENKNRQYKVNTMRHWYISEEYYCDEKVPVIRGQFYNRKHFLDGTLGRTSIIHSIKKNDIEKEFEIQTHNTLYHCSYDSLFFDMQDKYPNKLPDYEKIKNEFYKSVDKTNLTKNDILLLVSDYCPYFFEKLIYKNKDGSDGDFSAYPHIGMYTDTLLISGDKEFYESENDIDIRYYVYDSGFEFYSLDTDKRSLWIENCGDDSIYIFERMQRHIELGPGERILYKE